MLSSQPVDKFPPPIAIDLSAYPRARPPYSRRTLGGAWTVRGQLAKVVTRTQYDTLISVETRSQPRNGTPGHEGDVVGWSKMDGSRAQRADSYCLED